MSALKEDDDRYGFMEIQLFSDNVIFGIIYYLRVTEPPHIVSDNYID
jgi:hypothetical protein